MPRNRNGSLQGFCKSSTPGCHIGRSKATCMMLACAVHAPSAGELLLGERRECWCVPSGYGSGGGVIINNNNSEALLAAAFWCSKLHMHALNHDSTKAIATVAYDSRAKAYTI